MKRSRDRLSRRAPARSYPTPWYLSPPCALRRHQLRLRMAAGDMYHKAFADHEHPYLSYGLLYPKAAARHVDHTFHAEKVYILASGSLSKNTDAVTQLEDALRGKVVGVRRGMTPHTLWSECIAVARQVKELDADLLLTIGGGSLIDAAKIIALVCPFEMAFYCGNLSVRCRFPVASSCRDRSTDAAPSSGRCQ